MPCRRLPTTTGGATSDVQSRVQVGHEELEEEKLELELELELARIESSPWEARWRFHSHPTTGGADEGAGAEPSSSSSSSVREVYLRRALHFSLDASHVQPFDSVDALTTHFSPRRRLTCHPSFISTAVAHAIHSAAVLFFVDAGMPTAAAFHYLSLRPSAWTTFHQILTRLNFKPVADRQNSALKTRPRDIKLVNHECSMPFSFS
ncbi:uncharacterized protein IWZ02DRAFT_430123 [Phyllosticta citriasiana]|uniref:uncharacterized protein n=1 Tax=Phyllosticta citriasiana TaxID=595635 RepID=UPI0030FD3EEC